MWCALVAIEMDRPFRSSVPLRIPGDSVMITPQLAPYFISVSEFLPSTFAYERLALREWVPGKRWFLFIEPTRVDVWPLPGHISIRRTEWLGLSNPRLWQSTKPI